ncbi:amidohydrolase [Peniophora sp. CONT]|nr:amidohydrolase [Peniophora sp. CONT]
MQEDKNTPGCFTGLLQSLHLRTARQNVVTTATAPPAGSHQSHKGCELPPDYEHVADTCCNWGHDAKLAASPPSYASGDAEIYRPEVLATIEAELDKLDAALHSLNKSIHDDPELAFEERHASAALASFMAANGFTVTKAYLGLETAFRAEFQHGKGGRTLGVNSEMDALPGIGHACGHNLIAAAGAGVAVAVKAALIKHDIPGKVVLLGTPAEEQGCGKSILIERGAYKEMDACVMCHPSAGAPFTNSGSSLALQSFEVEYTGRNAHAGAQPWAGINALDAAVIAYTSIAALRQQVQPHCRLHGTLFGRNWAANIIPDYARMQWRARAPTWAEVQDLRDRMINCVKAGALATGCDYKIKLDDPYLDLRPNKVLADDYLKVANVRYGIPVGYSDTSASTDFGNVTYELPALHPGFNIPTQDEVSGNHTVKFTEAAGKPEAHKAMMIVIKALAHTGFRVVEDDKFYAEIKDEFEREVVPLKALLSQSS